MKQAIKIRNCENIKGIQHWKTDTVNFEEIIKIALYADDVTLFLSDERDVFHALQIFDSFSKISGLEVNKQKSEAMYLGNKKNCTDQIFGFTLTTKLKILGIYFSNTQSASCVEENWTGRIKVIKSLISLWEKRNLYIYISQFVTLFVSNGRLNY